MSKSLSAPASEANVCDTCRGTHAPDQPCDTLIPMVAAAGAGTQLMGVPQPDPISALEWKPPGVIAPTAPPHAPWTDSPGRGGTPVSADGQFVMPPSMDEEVDPLIGLPVGQFQIVRRVGRGGMGTVYLGEHTAIGSKVAIKFLHEHLCSNASLVNRFYAEARAVNVIAHENIVSIFDMNVLPPNRYYLVMEYLDGQPLTALCRSAVAPELTVMILSQILDALQMAHAAGIVHRDLKPENVYLIKRGRNAHFVKLLDFGIAKLFATEHAGEQTSANAIVGTPEYMAPEQGSGEKIDGRADIYSVGVIAYLLATGRLPFSTRGLTDMLIAHRTEAPVAPHELDPSLPRPLSDAIMKALAKKPADRFQSADEMREALEAAVRPSTNPGTQNPLASTPFAPPPIAIAPTPPADRVGPPRTSSAPEVPRVVTPPVSSPPLSPVDVDRVPAAQPTPVHARHSSSHAVKVIRADGQPPFEARLADVSRGGAFVRTELAPPPVFARVQLAVEAGGRLELKGEVVRHVTPAQAKAWNMEPGFGVQWLELTPQNRDGLTRLLSGLAVKSEADKAASATGDALAADVLARYAKRLSGDHYVILSLPVDADFGEVRQRGREVKKELDALRTRPLSDKQREQVDSAMQKVAASLEVLVSPQKRAEYDGGRGNYRGIARSLSAGLTVSELDAIRRQLAQRNETAMGKAHIHFISGTAWEQKGSLQSALEEYEKALVLDPLNLELHKRFWAIKKKQQAR